MTTPSHGLPTTSARCSSPTAPCPNATKQSPVSSGGSTTNVAAVDRPEDASLVRRFATWHVLRSLRRRVEHHHPNHRVATRYARNQVSTAIGFLDWLHQRRPRPLRLHPARRRPVAGRTATTSRGPPLPHLGSADGASQPS